MEKKQSIAQEMPFEAFFPVFLDTYLSEEKLTAYITEHHSSLTYPELLEFFQSEPVKQKLKSKWDFERASCINHSMQTIIEQTIGHTIAFVGGEATLYSWGKKNIFQNQSPEFVKQIQNLVSFYNGYFMEKLRGRFPHMVP
jgi:hypothetical protein